MRSIGCRDGRLPLMRTFWCMSRAADLSGPQSTGIAGDAFVLSAVRVPPPPPHRIGSQRLLSSTTSKRRQQASRLIYPPQCRRTTVARAVVRPHRTSRTTAYGPVQHTSTAWGSAFASSGFLNPKDGFTQAASLSLLAHARGRALLGSASSP